MSTDREALRLQDIIENIAQIESHVLGMDLGVGARVTVTLSKGLLTGAS